MPNGLSDVWGSRQSASAMMPVMVARKTMLRMQAILAIVMLPHMTHVPAWAIVFMACVFVWRLIATWRGWAVPPGWARAVLTLAVFAGIQSSYGTISGQHAGVALLLVLMTLKLTETGPKRDNCILIFLAYFVVATHFLFSQEMAMVLYLLASVILITAVLIDLNHPQAALPAKQLLAHSSKMTLTALPIMLLFFILFPRIPGPIWGLPSDTGAARSGLSDEMSPGDIGELIQSDEVAFRVRFDGDVPNPNQRYWRGPVLNEYDGRNWTIGNSAQFGYSSKIELIGNNVFDYEVIIEPTQRRWIYALDIPLQAPSGSRLDRNFRLVRWKDLQRQKIYRATSNPNYLMEEVLPAPIRQLTTELPEGFDPKSRALAKSWRKQGLNPEQIVEKALTQFREEPFYYTLRPPVLGRNAIDEFLFGTRRGFCGHYSGAFVVLMRAADIPARIVTGFQGMTEGIAGDYYLVRNSDAHAWAEVWLEGKGWQRVDPTAAVAPNRVEEGIGEALGLDEPLPSIARGSWGWIQTAQMRWDWMNAQWDRWVLGYGPELQEQVMRWLGLADWGKAILVLTFGTLGLLGLSSVGHFIRLRPTQSRDPLAKAWRRFDRKLKRKGIIRHPHEGPLDIANRAAEECPEIALNVRKAARIYMDLRYFENTDDLEKLHSAIKAI